MQLKGKLFTTFLIPLLIVGAVGFSGHFLSNRLIKETVLNDDLKIGAVFEMEKAAYGAKDKLKQYTKDADPETLNKYEEKLVSFKSQLHNFEKRDLTKVERDKTKETKQHFHQIEKINHSIIKLQKQQTTIIKQLENTLDTKLLKTISSKWLPSLTDSSKQSTSKKELLNAILVDKFVLRSATIKYAENHRPTLLSEIYNALEDFHTIVNKLQTYQLTSNESAWLKQIKTSATSVKSNINQIVRIESKQEKLDEKNKDFYIALHESLDQQVEAIAAHDLKQTSMYINRFFHLIVGSVIFIIIFSVFISWWLANRFILNPVSQLQSAVNAMARGEKTDGAEIETGDELGELAKSLSALSEDKSQAWTKSQIIKISQSIIGIRNIAKVLQITTDDLSNTLGVIYGAFYFMDNNADSNGDQYLKLQTSSPKESTNLLEAKIKVGDGPIGKCAQNRQMTKITDITDELSHVTSALSDKKAKECITIPVIYEEKIFGIFEFVVAKPLSQDQEIVLTTVIKHLSQIMHNNDLRTAVGDYY